MPGKYSPPTALSSAIAATIRAIPRGKVSTYGAVANAAGFPRYARHVAKVLSQISGLPWQRVLGAGGRIALKGEYGLEQRFLLEAEGVRFKGKRVDMLMFEYDFRGKRKPPSRRVPQRLPRKS